MLTCRKLRTFKAFVTQRLIDWQLVFGNAALWMKIKEWRGYSIEFRGFQGGFQEEGSEFLDIILSKVAEKIIRLPVRDMVLYSF